MQVFLFKKKERGRFEMKNCIQIVFFREVIHPYDRVSAVYDFFQEHFFKFLQCHIWSWFQKHNLKKFA